MTEFNTSDSSSNPADVGLGNTARLLGMDDNLDLSQRSNLVELDRQLHQLWGLGKNFVLSWSPCDEHLLLLVVPHYSIANYAVSQDEQAQAQAAHGQEFIASLLSGTRQLSIQQLERAAKLLHAEPTRLPLRQGLKGTAAELRVVENLVRRYSVSYASDRAAALFDIVGFSLLSPFEQMTQLNSLSHSLNSAHSKMRESRISIDFARSGTGDGYYIWNRQQGIEANTHLYHFMHLVLADNAIARRKAQGRTVPLLRAGFHLGSCYEFYHAEGLNPTLYTDIVGEVTIELARMIERALPGQILVGEFSGAIPVGSDDPPMEAGFGSIAFVDQAQKDLSQLNGLELSGDAIESIKCYLTGRAQADGSFSIRKLAIHDKHGLTRNAFNAKINIYRRAAAPILLGIEDRLLRRGSSRLSTAEHLPQSVS